jgi:uncharacterized protein YegL
MDSSLYYIRVGHGDCNFFENPRSSAPLQSVCATGIVRDNVAQFTLVQTFVNPHKDVGIEAVYQFPLYEGVAVRGFKAEVDGRKMVGRVEEKVAARKGFEEAVEQGKIASLLEQERPDVFQTSVGNIPPGKQVVITLTLLSEIKNDADESQIRFVLPTAVAPRYGSNRWAFRETTSTEKSHLSIDLSFAMSQPITSLQSPSHTIEVHLGTKKSPASSIDSPTTGSTKSTFDPKCARVSLTSDALLEHDLVIVVTAPGIEEPRALVERHPTNQTHAVALTFSPRFALNPIRSSELIFLIDRSGSMDGPQIGQARQALQLFLNSIPSESHYVNVIGFGSTHESLFPKSVEYDESSLKTASAYTRALRADMGGTEIASAFREVFERRRRDVPTQIFLLTDGQVWDVDDIAQSIREAVREGEKSNAFVRVFSLGVGNDVSHNLIEAVARAGHGYAQVVVDSERMEKKVIQLLKAALTPPVNNMWAQWVADDEHPSMSTGSKLVAEEGKDEELDDFEMVEVADSSAKPSTSTNATPNIVVTAPIDLFSRAVEEPTPLPQPDCTEIVAEILQSPFRIPPLYRGARFTLCAILSPSTPVPKEIIVRGTTLDGPVELRAKVGELEWQQDDDTTMLHTLTARKLLRDLEEGASHVAALLKKPTTTTQEQSTTDHQDAQMLKRLGIRLVHETLNHPPSTLELTKKEMIKIGLKYGLASKYTSWIAIDESDNFINTSPQAGAIQVEEAPITANRHGFRPKINLSGNRAMAAPRSSKSARPVYISAPLPAAPGPCFGGPGVTFGQQPLSSNPMLCGGALNFASNFGSQSPPGATTTLFGAAQPYTSNSCFQSYSGSPGSASFGAAQPCSQPWAAPSEEAFSDSMSDDLDPHVRLHALVQHQSFDGSFMPQPELGSFFHASVQEMQSALDEVIKASSCAQGVGDVDSTLHQLSPEEWRVVWATCLAVVYMEQQLGELQEEWELVVQKAQRKLELMVPSKEVMAQVKEAATKFCKLHHHLPQGDQKQQKP